MILTDFTFEEAKYCLAKLTLILVLFSSELVENRKIIECTNKQKFVI
jgi:hypothetical protein